MQGTEFLREIKLILISFILPYFDTHILNSGLFDLDQEHCK